MKVLLVKMSSLGDLVHTFVAVTDAAALRADVTIDWVVEEAFVDIARLHPAVHHVIPIALRRWRRSPLRALGEVRRFLNVLRCEHYDLVLDAQGLLKSALVSRAAYGPAMGFDAQAARERIAAMLYRQHYAAPLGGHAIDKLRGLFGNALDYAVGDRPADFGLQRLTAAGHWVFVHGTSWTNKEWPESFWTILARRAVAAGKSVLLPWGNEKERQRAERIAAASGASVAVRQSLGAIAKVLASASAVVSVDSGLGHLAAAFGVPTVALFGPTDSAQTGCRGATVTNLNAQLACAPCLARVCRYRGPTLVREGVAVEPACFARNDPDTVWRALMEIA